MFVKQNAKLSNQYFIFTHFYTLCAFADKVVVVVPVFQHANILERIIRLIKKAIYY